MALAIYKPGQGYWTRMLSAVGAGTLLLTGAAWIVRQLQSWPDAVIYQAVTAAVLILGGGALLYWAMNRPRVVDFFIATEAEMKKVNWPTRREIIGSTWVVICGTFLLTAMLFLIDVIFGWFFLQINVLQS